MSEFKGTKGPWFVKGRKPVDGDVHLLFADVNSKGEGYLVGGVCVWDDDKYSEQEAIHNANLIAAAPDLLELVMKSNHATSGSHTAAWQQKAKQAIAKALGETK